MNFQALLEKIKENRALLIKVGVVTVGVVVGVVVAKVIADQRALALEDGEDIDTDLLEDADDNEDVDE